MIAAGRSDRIASILAISMSAAALSLAIGNFGVVGTLVFWVYIPFIAVAWVPGAALLAWGLTSYMERRARSARSRGELWRVALLIAVPPALANGALGIGILKLFPPELQFLGAPLDPWTPLLSALWGALGLVYGTLAGLQPGRTT